MAVVVLPRSLVELFPGTPRRVDARGATVGALIADLDVRIPGLADRLCESGHRLRPHINVFVDADRASLDTPVRHDAVVHVIPAVSGG